MRALASIALLALVALGCERTTLIVAEDGGPVLDGAARDGGVDAGPMSEPVGGSECDQQDDCEACFSCAQGPRQGCVDLAVQCSDSTECVALVGCLNGCGEDEACARSCGSAHPSATSILSAFYVCAYCGACPADCRSARAWCDGPPF